MEKKEQYSITTNKILDIQPSELYNKEGWLYKKSPKLLVGWQVNAFITSSKEKICEIVGGQDAVL